MGLVSFVSQSSAGAAGTSVTITAPSAIVYANLLVALVQVEQSSNSVFPAVPTTSLPGFVLLASASIVSTTTGDAINRVSLFLYWKRASISEPASYTASSAASDGTITQTVCSVLQYSGATYTGDPIFEIAAVSGGPSVTNYSLGGNILFETTSGCKAIWSYASIGTTVIPPSSFINRTNVIVGQLLVSDRTQPLPLGVTISWTIFGDPTLANISAALIFSITAPDDPPPKTRKVRYETLSDGPKRLRLVPPESTDDPPPKARKVRYETLSDGPKRLRLIGAFFPSPPVPVPVRRRGGGGGGANYIIECYEDALPCPDEREELLKAFTHVRRQIDAERAATAMRELEHLNAQYLIMSIGIGAIIGSGVKSIGIIKGLLGGIIVGTAIQQREPSHVAIVKSENKAKKR